VSTVLSRLECASFFCPKALGKGALVPEKRIQLISENPPRLKRRQLGMNLAPWTNKKTLITLTIIATLATTTITLTQINNTTQAATIDPHPGLVAWWRLDEGIGAVRWTGEG